jgi:hypothetical protein
MCGSGDKTQPIPNIPSGVHRSASRPGRCTPRERAHTYLWIGSYVFPRTDVGTVDKRKTLVSADNRARPLSHTAMHVSLFIRIFVIHTPPWAPMALTQLAHSRTDVGRAIKLYAET